jgi:hypothetical protein
MRKAVLWAVAGFAIPLIYGCTLFWALIWAIATAAASAIGD